MTIIEGLNELKVSILPRLATGIKKYATIQVVYEFLFFPVLRRGS